MLGLTEVSKYYKNCVLPDTAHYLVNHVILNTEFIKLIFIYYLYLMRIKYIYT